MKAVFLKISGVKTEKEFYDKYPTEQAFFDEHPEMEDVKLGPKGPNSQLYKTFLENFKKGLAYEANNDYEKVNDSIRDEKGNPIKSRNALGKYQFVPQSHWANIQKFAKDSGLPVPQTYDDFLKNHTFQDQYFEYYVQKEVFPWAQENKGKVPGLALDDLGYMYHHDGKGGANEFVRTGKFKEATKYNPKGEDSLNGFRIARKANGGTPVYGYTNEEVATNYEKFKNEIAEIEKNPNHLSADLIGKMKLDVHQRYTTEGYIDDFNAANTEKNKANEISANNQKKVLTGLKTMLENPDYLSATDVKYGKPFNNITMAIPRSEYEQLSEIKEFDKYKKYFVGNASKAKPGKNKEYVTLSIPTTNNKNNLLNELQNDIRSIPGNEDFSIYDKNGKLSENSNNYFSRISNDVIQNELLSDTKLQLPSHNLSRINEVIPKIAPIQKVYPDVVPGTTTEQTKPEETPAAATTPAGPSDTQQWIAYQKEKDAAAQKAKDDSLLSDYFGNGLDETVPEDPNAKKKDIFPYADVLSQISGTIAGLGMANKKINYRDEQVNDDFRNYAAELSKLSQIGLRPEEESYAKRMLTEAYQGSVNKITENSNGNRNTVLGNLGRVDAQRNKGLMDIAIADAQAKNEALGKYGEAMKYINEFDARREIGRAHV